MDFDYVVIPALILLVGALLVWLSLRRILLFSIKNWSIWRKVAERIVLSLATLACAAVAASASFNAVSLLYVRAHNPPPGDTAEENCHEQFGAEAGELDSFTRSGEKTVRTGPYGALPILIFSQDPLKTLSQPNPPKYLVDLANVWNQMQGDLLKLSTHSRRIIAKGSTHFIEWMFYARAAASVFVYRRHDPEGSRPYRVPAYPLTPLVFILAARALVVNTVVKQLVQARVGLGIVLLGAPAYALWRRNAKLSGREYIERSKLQAQIQTAICLDECISNLNHDARAAIELKACRIIKIKLGRVSGHTEARQVQAARLEGSIPVWCGSMLEAGIHRAHNIAMSTLPGFTLPGDVSPCEHYWTEDIIEPAVEVTSKGTIRVPQTPGLGYVVKRDFVEKLTVRRDNWGAPAFVSLAVEVPSC